jgi:hypothetical protein
MLRQGRELWRSLLYLADSEPPKLVEFVMLMVGFGLLLVAFVLAVFLSSIYYQPYLILAVIFAVGSSASCLVREGIAPSVNSHKVQTANGLLLGLSLCTLWLTITYQI